MAKKIRPESQTTSHQPSKRAYVSQSDVPSTTLEQSLRVPTAIAENYASRPVSPLELAHAMMMSPTSGPFRQFCGASIAYGLTEGGYNASEIKLTPLGKRIVQPIEEGDDVVARREAILKPRIIREFLERYANAQLPRLEIALNVLNSMGIPREKAKQAYELIQDSAQLAGFIRDIKGKQYVDLRGVTTTPATNGSQGVQDDQFAPAKDESPLVGDPSLSQSSPTKPSAPTTSSQESSRRVFITHGKNREFVDPIKRLLEFGELIPVVSVERQSVSKPVPDKVMDDMRTCGAAIIHVDSEQTLIDKDAKEHVVINPNVLIEIGAAMALFGRRFILLVRDGVRLPSNLQGLYEVRYSGEVLDGDATIRLLGAIKDIKKSGGQDIATASNDDG